MNNYKFNAEDVEFTLWQKFVTWWVGFTGRRTAFKVFCRDTHIDPSSPISEARSKFPEKYLVNHKRIDTTASFRDKIILTEYSRYNKIKNSLQQAIEEKNTEITKHSTAIDEEKASLGNYKTNLKTVKDSFDRASLEQTIELTEIRIKNLTTELEELKNNKKTLETQLEENKKTWSHQIELCTATYKNLINSFCENYCKKITKKLYYNKFTFQVPKYSDSVNKVIEG